MGQAPSRDASSPFFPGIFFLDRISLADNTSGVLDRPSRSHPSRLELLEIEGRPNLVFLTVAASQRRSVFDRETVHRALRAAWTEASFWRVGRYVILPDHLHLFCAPGTTPPGSLRSWVKYWKRLVSKSGVFGGEKSVWLRDSWDTQLRSAAHYAEKWAYVRQNPVRAGLVDHPEDWPHQGELNFLEWRGD